MFVLLAWPYFHFLAQHKVICLILQRDKELADRLILHGGPGEFNYLNQSGCVRLEGVDDEAKFDALRLAFEVVQIPSDHVDGIFSVLSAILWLGNLTFKVREKETNCDVHVAACSPTSDFLSSRLAGSQRLKGTREENELPNIMPHQR